MLLTLSILRHGDRLARPEHIALTGFIPDPATCTAIHTIVQSAVLTSQRTAGERASSPSESSAALSARAPKRLLHADSSRSAAHAMLKNEGRFHRLHAPPILAFLDIEGFRPALPPHPSAPAARALALAADFSFSFLPSHCRHWTVQDIRDGRVLLGREPRQHGRPPVFREIAVCDPLHRRYVLLPPVPHDLAASLEYPFPPVRKARCKPFLVPLGDEEAAAGETTFRVILMAHCKTSLAAFVFSSSTGQWQAAASKGWSDLALSESDMAEMSRVHPSILMRHYAYGCFYWDWVEFGSNKLLLLDTSNMEFSIADLPPGEWNKRGLAIVEAGEGRLGMFGFHGEIASDLSYTVAWNKGKSPSLWQAKKTISLDSGYIYCITDATQRYLLLTRTKASSQENRLVGYLSMDVKALQLQRVYEQEYYLQYETYTYINFPPSLLSSRRI